MRQPKGVLFEITVFINTGYRLQEEGTLTGFPVDDLLAIPVRLSAEAGYVRDWCGRFDGLRTQYDLRPVREGENRRTINGVLRAIYDESYFSLENERGRFEKIPMEHFETLGWQSLPDFPVCHAYKARSVEPVNIHYPILQTYLDTCLKGYLEYGEAFAIEFLETTTGWSKFWLNDREVARRPWIFESKYKLLDSLLANHPSSGNTFHHRRLEVEYAKYFLQGQSADSGYGEEHRKPAVPEFSGKLKNQTENFIFGYGSLINSLSRFQTNPDSKDAIPVRLSADFGYVRCWNFHGPTSRLTALGLRKTEKSEVSYPINGIIYPAGGEDMSLCDEREEGYYRVPVSWEHVEPISWNALPDAGRSRLWMYVPEEPGFPDIDFPILQTYIDVCLTGCLEFGEDFAKEFLETTFAWNQFWINDRVLARRPWIHCPNYAAIDELLVKFPRKNNVFGLRKLAVEFAALFAEGDRDRI